MAIFQIYNIDSGGVATPRGELLDATKPEALDIALRMQRAAPEVQTWFLNCEPEAPYEPRRMN